MPKEDAVGQIYGFMMGGMVFVAAIAGILVFSNLAGSDPKPAQQAAQDVDAEGLVGILGSPGAGWADPDTLARLGLGTGNASALDPDRLALLNPGDSVAADNGLLDYAEAKALLGLSDSAGFQLQVVPIDELDILQQHDFSHMKALYIGDWTSVGSITLGVGQGSIANANTQLNTTMAANTALERTVIDSVGVEFDNQVHLTVGTPTILVQVTTVPPVTTPLLTLLGLPLWDGDVLYDNKQYLDAVLPTKLATGGYDLLILGSGIDHSTLTANSVKGAVDTFVRAGGTLMVFGSPGANFNWMQPVLDVSASSVSGTASAPDPDHEILTSPWMLDWTNYNTNNLGWTLGTPGNFQNFIVQGGKPVLALNNPGTIGSGAVFLSSIQPRAVAQSLGSTEAMHYMFNLLLYVDQSPEPVYEVEFGPDPPSGASVSSALRTMVIETDDMTIPVRVQLLAWETYGH